MRERKARQDQLLTLLRQSADPQRGDDLAKACQVTRQVVVHEIALLRAMGIPIVATPRGYLLNLNQNIAKHTVISVRHTPLQTRDELYALIDHGLVVDDVMVEHPLYGELRGMLQLRSRQDVDQFLEQLRLGHVALLSSLTDGYHLHTVTYRHVEDLTRALKTLVQKHIDVLS